MRLAGENLKININDIVVNYDDNGPVYAPAIIFIHGTPFNKTFWDLQTEALKSNFRVVTYDLRGHGDTKGPAADLSIDTFTDDLIEFMDALDLERVIVCGHSLGGYIALDAVDKYPGRFNALMLSGVQCMEDSDEVREHRRRLLESLPQMGMEKYAEEVMKSLFAATSFITRKEEVRSVRRMILSTAPSAMASALTAMSRRRESCSNLWSIKLPTLLMAGREDDVTPLSVARFMRDNITGSVLNEIEYAGHLANLENTHEFNQYFKAFVDRVCTKKHLSKHCSDEVPARPARNVIGNGI
jgi:3-oxoadipate enol-lactonase